MSAKARSIYRCTNCGADHPRWAGRCDVCGEWNTLVEETVQRSTTAGAAKGGSSRRIGGHKSLGEGGSVAQPRKLKDVAGTAETRWKTGLAEFDFVLGGGIVPGSMILIGGEPGIGKSTLLLQVAAQLEASGRRTLEWDTTGVAPGSRDLSARLDDGADIDGPEGEEDYIEVPLAPVVLP